MSVELRHSIFLGAEEPWQLVFTNLGRPEKDDDYSHALREALDGIRIEGPDPVAIVEAGVEVFIEQVRLFHDRQDRQARMLVKNDSKLESYSVPELWNMLLQQDRHRAQLLYADLEMHYGSDIKSVLSGDMDSPDLLIALSEVLRDELS